MGGVRRRTTSLRLSCRGGLHGLRRGARSGVNRVGEGVRGRLTAFRSRRLTGGSRRLTVLGGTSTRDRGSRVRGLRAQFGTGRRRLIGTMVKRIVEGCNGHWGRGDCSRFFSQGGETIVSNCPSVTGLEDRQFTYYGEGFAVLVTWEAEIG